MLKKIIFLAILLVWCGVFFGKDACSDWPPGSGEKIELAYAFTERTNENGDFDLAGEAHFNAALYDEVKEVIFLNENPLSSGSIIIYPNPCNPWGGQQVRITNLSLDSQVVVRIFDLAGNLVRTLEENEEITLEGESKTATWDGTNEAGEDVARGIYLVFVTDEKGTRAAGKIAIVNK
ncbi:hypothetical protein ES703_111019 [subsurface metagenome]